MSLPWAAIYTTNYDFLIERALQKAHRQFTVVKSNYDWDNAHRPGVISLFKIHGCLSQDRTSGHRASMILTYDDYDSFGEYRELLFDRLKMELTGGEGVFIGYSLQDQDIKDILRHAVQQQRGSGAPGKVHLLMYQIDDERAAIWRSRGIKTIVQGDVNSFASCLHSEKASTASVNVSGLVEMPPSLAACTIFVPESGGSVQLKRLYYGAPASYSDIRADATFERDQEGDLSRWTNLAAVILGAAGTGKSTLARRMMIRFAEDSSLLLFEHRFHFPLLADEWIRFETKLRSDGRKAVLLIDNCTPHQRQINQIIRNLPEVDSALRLFVTAETSAWKVRQKDPRLFSHSTTYTLSRLSDAELRRLLDLILENKELKSLTDDKFLRMALHEQLRTLRTRCRSDMFVCLKALFSAESLDDILLKEFGQIADPFRDIYRITCALEAAGAIPHRQMVLRLTNVAGQMVAGALDVLEGLVDETSDNESLGIYLWNTRHEVIANIISRYKYGDADELYALLSRVISTANPSYHVEVRSLREMCNAERGIRGLPSSDQRISLYRLIVQMMPTDRVSRHRLVKELIDSGRLADAEAEIRAAVQEVSLEPPLQRYKVLLALARSRNGALLIEDRKAILHNAFSEAESGLDRFPDSKYIYFAAADIAEEWFYVTGERGRLEWVKHLLTQAQDRLLDPDIREKLRSISMC